jgi:hypothetical protein
MSTGNAFMFAITASQAEHAGSIPVIGSVIGSIVIGSNAESRGGPINCSDPD